MSPRESNWGRWGSDDERGAVNLLTPERVHGRMPAPAERPGLPARHRPEARCSGRREPHFARSTS